MMHRNPETPRIRLSLRAMLLLIAALSLSLTLAQLPMVTNGILLAIVATALNVLLPLRTWRCLCYGALLGMLCVIAAMMVDVRLRTGVLTASNYSESSAIGAVARVWRPYILPVGAFLGGAVGFLLATAVRGEAHPAEP